MSKIDEQIKALQLKKTKIEYIEHLVTITESSSNGLPPEVTTEIVAQVREFLRKLAASIEEGSALAQPEVPAALSADQQKALTLLLDKTVAAMNRPQTAVANTAVESPKAATPPPVMRQMNIGPHEMLAFAMENRHLSNKAVMVTGPTGQSARGTVVGLQAPNVLVRMDAGPTIEAPLNKISEL